MQNRHWFALGVIYAVAVALSAAVLVVGDFALIIAAVIALSIAGIAQFSFLNKLVVQHAIPKEERVSQQESVARMESKLHALSGDVSQLRQDLSRAVWSLQQRMPNERQYVDLLEKIIEVENRVSKVKAELRNDQYHERF